jgi:hypothetical protein
MLIWAHSFGGLSSPSVGPVALGLWWHLMAGARERKTDVPQLPSRAQSQWPKTSLYTPPLKVSSTSKHTKLVHGHLKYTPDPNHNTCVYNSKKSNSHKRAYHKIQQCVAPPLIPSGSPLTSGIYIFMFLRPCRVIPFYESIWEIICCLPIC